MSSFKALVYDDQFEAAERWANQIRNHVKDVYDSVFVETPGKQGFEELLEAINKRQIHWREGRTGFPQDERHGVDEADVVVLDYDLLKYSESSDTTGSRLAYLLRCFSECGFIVVLNRFGQNVFDLSLSYPPEDFGDLHLGEVQLANPGLWSFPFSGYRPWYWPVVPTARSNLEECVKEVERNLEAPILEFLGLDQSISWLPRRAQEFMSPKGRIEDVTFKSLAESVHVGISRKDKLTPKQVARVAAARVVALLNSVVIPEQSLLVDAPHLVSRIPGLLESEGAKRELWNKLCSLSSQETDDLLDDRVQKHKFRKSHWLWRPAWIWPEISADDEIDVLRDPWRERAVDLVFCEDISQFVPSDRARDFKARVSPPYIRRFVFKFDAEDSHTYVSETGSGGPLDPGRVEYIPQSALSE